MILFLTAIICIPNCWCASAGGRKSISYEQQHLLYDNELKYSKDPDLKKYLQEKERELIAMEKEEDLKHNEIKFSGTEISPQKAGAAVALGIAGGICGGILGYSIAKNIKPPANVTGSDENDTILKQFGTYFGLYFAVLGICIGGTAVGIAIGSGIGLSIPF